MALFIGSDTVLNPPRDRKFSILLISLPGFVPTLNTLPWTKPETPEQSLELQEMAQGDNKEAEWDNQSFPSFGLVEKF